MLKGIEEKPVTEKNHYLNLFRSLRRKYNGKEPAWMTSCRENAIQHFAELDFPTPRLEEWKYTNIAPIASTPFRPASPPSPEAAGARKLGLLYGGSVRNRLVFLNGYFARGLSQLSHLPEEAKVMSLASALTKDFNSLEGYLARYASFEKNAFTALNTAFMQEGALIYLPPGVRVEEPIYLFFVVSPGKEKVVIQPRNLIVAGRGSRVSVVETYLGLSPGSYFTNSVTEIIPGEGADVEYLKIQRESEEAFHVGTTQVYGNRECRFFSFYFDRGARLARNNLNVLLDAEGCACSLNGLYLPAGRQHVDNSTVIDHAKPRGMSRQLYKGILDGKAKGVFSGKIFVRKGAQKTDAEQKNKNLLLSGEASVDTRPQLEIFADDVKCSHGAAVGQLEGEQLFYLKSRGLAQTSAEALLTYGFANEVLSRVPVEGIRTELDRLLAQRLAESRGREGIL